MDKELETQYSAMLTHVISDKTEEAQAILSNILSAKLATALQTHNVATALANSDNATALSANTETPPTETPPTE